MGFQMLTELAKGAYLKILCMTFMMASGRKAVLKKGDGVFSSSPIHHCCPESRLAAAQKIQEIYLGLT